LHCIAERGYEAANTIAGSSRHGSQARHDLIPWWLLLN
jgi:hypothetical protein